MYVALNNGELFELPDSMKGRILESIRQAKQETDSMGMDNAGLAESSLESEPAPEVYII